MKGLKDKGNFHTERWMGTPKEPKKTNRKMMDNERSGWARKTKQQEGKKKNFNTDNQEKKHI